MKLSAGSMLSGALVAGSAAVAYLILAPPAPTRAPAAGAAATSKKPAAQATAAARPAAPARAASARRGEVEVVAEASWGEGPGQLGHALPQEASAEGPMSLAVDGDGRIFVLDQVNGRVVVLGPGEAPREIALPTDTYQDIAIDRSGGLVLLDRLVTSAVLFLSPSGEIRHQIPLLGAGVDEGGLVTALFAREDGVWVEIEHGPLVRVASADGVPEERRVEPGRRGRGGPWVRARLLDPRSAEVFTVSAGGAEAPLARVEFKANVLQLSALEIDGQGRVFLGASLVDEGQGQGLGDQVVVLTPQGVEEARVTLPANHGPEEQLCRLRLGGDGALYHLGLSAEGAAVRRWRP